MDYCYIIMAQSIPSMPIPPGHLLGICHLVGPGSVDLSGNLYPGVWHLSICLEEGNVILFSIVSLKNMSQKLNIQIKL